MSLPSTLLALTARQRGLFTTDQAYEHGMTRSALATRVRRGDIERLAPRVLCLAGLKHTSELRVFAAWLETGGVSAVSLSSAGATWGYGGFELEPVQISRLRDGTFPPPSIGRVHTTRVLPDTHVTNLDGLLVTTPTRTLFDLAPLVHEARLERLIDRAWSRRLTNGALLHRTLRELEGRGRAGIQIMRALLEVRGPDYIPPDSNLESRFRQVIRDDGQSEMERQRNLGGIDWIGRVDFVDPVAKVIVEIQSDLFHASISDQRADAERRRKLVEAGWTVLEVTEFEVWHRPEQLCARIRKARSGR